MKTLTARRVRRARRIIAKDACPARWGIRHRDVPLDGLFFRCRNCKVVL